MYCRLVFLNSEECTHVDSTEEVTPTDADRDKLTF